MQIVAGRPQRSPGRGSSGRVAGAGVAGSGEWAALRDNGQNKGGEEGEEEAFLTFLWAGNVTSFVHYFKRRQ